MHSLKSYTADRANALLGQSGQFWLHESYDHWVRDTDKPLPYRGVHCRQSREGGSGEQAGGVVLWLGA